MRLPVRSASVFPLALFVMVAATVLAQRAATSQTSPGNPADVTTQIVASANALLKTLDDAGRGKVQFAFEGPQKTKWSNFPTGIFQREGLRMGDLTPEQRSAVITLLSTR